MCSFTHVAGEQMLTHDGCSTLCGSTQSSKPPPHTDTPLLQRWILDLHLCADLVYRDMQNYAEELSVMFTHQRRLLYHLETCVYLSQEEIPPTVEKRHSSAPHVSVSVHVTDGFTCSEISPQQRHKSHRMPEPAGIDLLRPKQEPWEFFTNLYRV